MNTVKNVLHRVGMFLLVLDCVCAWSQHLGLPKGVSLTRSWRLKSTSIGYTSSGPLNDFSKALDNRLLQRDVNSLLLRSPRKAVNHPVPTNLMEIQHIKGRYVDLRGETKYQLAYRYKTNEQVKNHELKDVVRIVQAIIQTGTFKSAIFTAIEEQHELAIKTPPGINRVTYSYKVKKIPPSNELESFVHDRAKNTFIAVDAPFLEALGITYKDFGSKVPISRPRIGMTHKLGQIQKFVEILDGLVKSVPDLHVATKTDLKIADMGSGLAYLTFAVHAHFQKTFPQLRTVGVERRAELAHSTDSIARKLGVEFDGLRFESSSIGDAEQSLLLQKVVPRVVTDATHETDHTKEKIVSKSNSALDVLMALHACDTATDDAIFHGITHNSSIIVVSPCCHKEVRRQLESHNGQITVLATTATDNNSEANTNSCVVHPLSNVLIHGIYRERHAEMLTDTLRALCLECSGYDTKIFEFVSGEHTAKNTMIAATKRASPLTVAKKEAVVKKIHDLMACCGLRSQRLVSMLHLN